ncbi:hypothetical protein ACHAXS_008967 [Conticribra weissflogii]
MKSTATILSVALSAAPGAVAAFSSQATRVNVASIRCPIGAAGAITAAGSKLYMNIPAPTTEGGASPEEIKAAADREAPPSSFYELQRASVKAAKMAIADDHRLLEIEFPPLPAKVLEMDDVSAYDVAKANVNLALDFAKSFAATGSNVAIMLPDEDECNIMKEDLKMDEKPYPNVMLTSLRRSEEGDNRIFKAENLLIGLLGQGSGGTVKPIPNINMYVILVASAQELPDIEELYEQIKDIEPEKSDMHKPVIVMYNLKLDVLRGDLGAPAFPSKDFQDRFLSRVKPVYYLRTRQYSRSTNKPPFILNYQGCLFRSYPGHYQTLLDTGTGRYKKVVGNDIRPALGEFKEQLTDALRDEGAIPKKEDEGALFGFLRTGYKTTTWWEEERENASMEWRT